MFGSVQGAGTALAFTFAFALIGALNACAERQNASAAATADGASASDKTASNPGVPPDPSIDGTPRPGSDPETNLLAPFDLTYGVYLSGAKVGWMRTQLGSERPPKFEIVLHATVAGMGKTSKIELREWRSYNADTEALDSVFFSQRATTGAVEIRGKRKGTRMQLDITAGGTTRTEEVEVTETLADALAVTRLARAAKTGAKATTKHFDASVQRTLVVHHEVTALETRLFGGVPTHTVKIESHTPETGIRETAWLDDTGKVLETRISGYFVARLEAPDVAKKLDYRHDLLVASAVPTPRPIDNAKDRAQLTVAFKGFGDLEPPVSKHQKVRREGDRLVFDLVRATEIPNEPLSAPRGEALGEYLAATAFIQSDDAEIRSAATTAARGAKTVREAVNRLIPFVNEHIDEEYVPAYSNALEALHTRRGDCSEHSVLFVALARALGIPARVAVGIAYSPAVYGFGWHAWAEIYAEGQWYSTDPMWNQPIADATHIKLADGGPLEQVRIIMVLGQLEVVGL